MQRVFYAFAVVVCSCLAGISETRVALIIGNSDYSAAPRLENPVNDAQAIGTSLERLGFDVMLGTDQDIDEMRALLREFSIRAEGSDLAVFFYAGHGLQVAGHNYLVPTDASLERESDLDFLTIDLQLVLNQLERASKNSIVLLDACRDNPFETKLSRSMGAARSSSALSKGLAPVETGGGALIGYATDPGEVAYDGDGNHSPFTEALLEHIETPGLEINSLMTRVRAQVVRNTEFRQRPWSTSSLLVEVFLAPEKDAADELVVALADTAPDAPLEPEVREVLPSVPVSPKQEINSAVPLPELQDDQIENRALVLIDEAAKAPPIDPVCEYCPEVVALEGGRFNMGSDVKPEERPVTEIDLPPFKLSVAEVTVGEFRKFVETAGHAPGQGCFVWNDAGRMRNRGSANWENPGYELTDDLPVSCVNWRDAVAYTEWLTEVSGQTVRLPSEAEMEYSIRAGSDDEYPFDGTPEGTCEVVNAADRSSRFKWRNTACEDGYPDVAPVSGLPKNAFGLAGISGNLWEWVGDCWNASHKGASPDGQTRDGSCESRVLRGGSWDDPLENLRSSYRVGIPANRRQANVGFRVAIEN